MIHKILAWVLLTVVWILSTIIVVQYQEIDQQKFVIQVLMDHGSLGSPN